MAPLDACRVRTELKSSSKGKSGSFVEERRMALGQRQAHYGAAGRLTVTLPHAVPLTAALQHIPVRAHVSNWRVHGVDTCVRCRGAVGSEVTTGHRVSTLPCTCWETLGGIIAWNSFFFFFFRCKLGIVISGFLRKPAEKIYLNPYIVQVFSFSKKMVKSTHSTKISVH